MKLDELCLDAAQVFVSTNKDAGMVWYAGMSDLELTQTVASFASSPGFRAALGRVVAILAAEAGTEAWVVERGADGEEHLVRRSTEMTTAMLAETFTRLGLAALEHLAAQLLELDVDPGSLSRFAMDATIQANDLPPVVAGGVIFLVNEQDADASAG